MPREKSRHRDRDKRSSSYSSDSSYERKRSKSRYKRRSRSHERSESSSHRRKRSSSRTRRRKSYSRSPSRDRYERSRRRSTSRSRSKRDRSHSRSSSKGRSKYSRSKKSHKRRSSSSGSSTSFEIGNSPENYSEDLSEILDSLLHLNLKSQRTQFLSKRPMPQKVNLDDTESKIEKAIKAAEAAGLTMTKIPTYEFKDIEIKEDMPTITDRNLLAEINSDSFVQKSFTSSKSKKESKNIVIDLDSQTVKLPETEIKQKEEFVFNFDEIPSEEELKEMWIKKVYQFRKKMLRGEI